VFLKISGLRVDMAGSLLHIFASAALFTAGVHAEVEVGVMDLPVDDACDADDASCSLSLRQLRGELSVQGAPEESGAYAAADIAAEVASSIAAGIVAEVKAGAAAGAVKSTRKGNATIEAVIKALGGSACVGQTGWDVDFASHSYRCAFTSMANAYRSGRCMASKQGVSYECGACIGQLIHCGTKCVRECCYGRCTDKPTCVECGNRYCAEDFKNCAGVDTPAR